MKYFIIFILLLVPFSCISQDLIVTKAGDSIECKIVQVKETEIIYSQGVDEEAKTLSIPYPNVYMYLFDYQNKLENSDNSLNKANDYPVGRLWFNMGWSNRTIKTPHEQTLEYKEYLKDLKKGNLLEFGLTIFFYKEAGAGFKMNFAEAEHSATNVPVIVDTTQVISDLRDETSMGFFGPLLCFRQISNNKRLSFLLDFSYGKLYYKDLKTAFKKYSEMRGKTNGYCIDVGVDVAIISSISLGFQLSYQHGKLKSYELTDSANNVSTVDLEENEYIDLSRFDYSFGLIINL